MKSLLSAAWYLLACAITCSLNAQTIVETTFRPVRGAAYGNPHNWSPQEVPDNSAAKSYNVTIPASVIMDINAKITSLSLSASLLTDGRSLVVTGTTKNEGVIRVNAGGFFATGALANFDATTRTLTGGEYDVDENGILKFGGADIVHNSASITLGGYGAWITDGNGHNGLRNFTHNQPQGRFAVIGTGFAARSDFRNEGNVTVLRERDGYGFFRVAEGHRYIQTSGETLLVAEFDGDMDIDGGVLNAYGIFGLGGGVASPFIDGNVTVGAAVVTFSEFLLEGSLRLSADSTFRGFFGSFPNVSVYGTTVLDGEIEIDDRDRFPPRRKDVAAVLRTPFVESSTGTFSNAPQGARVTTMSGRGSYVVTYKSDGVYLSKYRPTMSPAQLVNISTRGQVGTGDNIVIAGFIIRGPAAKKVLVRGLGPSMSTSGVPGLLDDPTLELRDSTGAVLGTNDDWTETRAEIDATGLPPANDRESALVRTLEPGSYTILLRGKNDTTGVALVEVYDLDTGDQSRLANTSTRGFVDRDNALIAGTIVGGTSQGDAYLVVRAIGTGLIRHGVAGSLEDPTIELRDGDGMLVAANDSANFRSVPPKLIPNNELDAATGVMAPPGNNTAIVRGKNGASGIALVEIYDLNR